MNYVVVMPWRVREYRDACLARCKLDNVLEIDNSAHNRGVMRSHNIGVDEMRAQDADWLIVLSAAIRFGDAGGLDFVRALEHCADHAVVNAEGVYGWHFLAFARDTVELAGRWDENFYPYGWDDADYAIRIHKSRPGAVWSGIKALDLSDTVMGHSLADGTVTVDNEHHLDYFEKKWGHRTGPPFEMFYDTPWDDPTIDVRWWPENDPFTRGARWDQPAPADGAPEAP